MKKGVKDNLLVLRQWVVYAVLTVCLTIPVSVLAKQAIYLPEQTKEDCYWGTENAEACYYCIDINCNSTNPGNAANQARCKTDGYANC